MSRTIVTAAETATGTVANFDRATAVGSVSSVTRFAAAAHRSRTCRRPWWRCCRKVHDDTGQLPQITLRAAVDVAWTVVPCVAGIRRGMGMALSNWVPRRLVLRNRAIVDHGSFGRRPRLSDHRLTGDRMVGLPSSTHVETPFEPILAGQSPQADKQVGQGRVLAGPTPPVVHAGEGRRRRRDVLPLYPKREGKGTVSDESLQREDRRQRARRLDCPQVRVGVAHAIGHGSLRALVPLSVTRMHTPPHWLLAGDGLRLYAAAARRQTVGVTVREPCVARMGCVCDLLEGVQRRHHQ